MSESSLEERIQRYGSAVRMLRSAPALKFPFLYPPEYSSWHDEQRAWKTTSVLFDQSHHMADIRVSGPDVRRLFSDVGVNSMATFGTDHAKQFIACSPDGRFIGDGILTGGYDVEVVKDPPTAFNPGRRQMYRYELNGPRSGEILEKAQGAPIPQIGFFHMGELTLAGRRVRVLNHTMAGAPGADNTGLDLMGPGVLGRYHRRMRTAAVLWRSAHPGPTLVVSAIVAALGVAAGLDAGRLAVLTTAVLCGQLSIGLSNDARDALRDRANSRHDKPLARPGAPIRAAWTTAFATAGLAVVLSAVLGWPVTAAHAVFIGCGWAYNAALKSTPWSVACFVVGFAVVPSLAPLALPDPAVAPAWAWIAGAALGVAVHFSNVLPDLEDDARTGVRGLPHRLGRRVSTVVAFVTLLVGAGAALVGSAVQEGRVAPVTWAVAAAVAVLVVGGSVAALVRAPDRMSFRIVMLAGLLLAVQLVIGTWAR